MSLDALPLSSFATIHAGGRAPQDPSSYSETGDPFVRAGSLSKLLDGADESSLERLEPIVAKTHGLRLFPAGTVLLAKSGMSATKGHIYRLRAPAYVVSHLAALVPLDASEGPFLVRALRQFPPTVLIKDPAYPSIRLSDLKNLRLRAPRDPAERQRIADILDRAEALRVRRRSAIAQIDSLLLAAFFDMFADGHATGVHWPMHPVSDYVLAFQGGKSLKSESDKDLETRNRILKISAVTGMRYRADENKPVPDAYKPPQSHFVRPGDLLFSRANTSQLVGAVAYVEETPPSLLLPDKIWRFVWREPLLVEPLFVWALFRTAALRDEIGRRATGTSGSMKNISQKKLMAIKTILPPLDLQREFVRLAIAVRALERAYTASLSDLENLFATLQRRAFQGEL